MIVDLAGVLAGVAALMAAWYSRKTKKEVAETNGGSTLRDAQNRQELALAALLDGQRSLGHQVGEIRADMRAQDQRLTTEVQRLAAFHQETK